VFELVSADTFIQRREGGSIGKEGWGKDQYICVVIIAGMEVQSS
jgi:hypothetical protein